MKLGNFLSALACVIGCVCFANVAQAGIAFEVVDEPDGPGAPDRKTLVYHLDDAFAAGDGLNILFNPQWFADLDPRAPSAGDWFGYAAQPVPDAPLDGIASFVALGDIAPHGRLEVSFTWLGGGLPGSQAYELFDAQFNIVGGGLTTPASPVPEPSSATLMLAGALLLARRHRANRRAA